MSTVTLFVDGADMSQFIGAVIALIRNCECSPYDENYEGLKLVSVTMKCGSNQSIIQMSLRDFPTVSYEFS